MSANRNIPEDKANTALFLQQSLHLNERLQARPNWLGHRDGAAEVDVLLLSGATMAEMESKRGAIREHLRHLRVEHGLDTIEDNGIYRFVLPTS